MKTGVYCINNNNRDIITIRHTGGSFYALSHEHWQGAGIYGLDGTYYGTFQYGQIEREDYAFFSKVRGTHYIICDHGHTPVRVYGENTDQPHGTFEYNLSRVGDIVE